MTLKPYDRARRRPRKPTYLPIGTVGADTLDPFTVLCGFVDTAQMLRLTRQERTTVEGFARAINVYNPAVSEFDVSEACEVMNGILNNHTPDFCYFGAHPNDGADFGCWVDWSSLEIERQAGGCVLNERLPIGRDTEGATHALEVNDHGNATLYRRAGNRWLEVWSIV